MKAFRFRLQRALEWRETRLSLEEARLESLHAAVRDLKNTLVALEESSRRSAVSLQESATLQGSQLRALEAHLRWATRQRELLRTRIQQAIYAAAAQQQVMLNARRDVKLLERLKETRLTEWKKEEAGEIETLAGEYAIGQWRRNHSLSGEAMRTARKR